MADWGLGVSTIFGQSHIDIHHDPHDIRIRNAAAKNCRASGLHAIIRSHPHLATVIISWESMYIYIYDGHEYTVLYIYICLNTNTLNLYIFISLYLEIFISLYHIFISMSMPYPYPYPYLSLSLYIYIYIYIYIYAVWIRFAQAFKVKNGLILRQQDAGP